jgi:two-component system response regulator HydG
MIKVNGRTRVLIVDDEADFCDDLAAMLNGRFRLDVAHSGQDALTAVSHFCPDIVLLDIMLGSDPDGLEVLSQLNAEPEAPAVIMLSGRNEPAVVVEAMNRGALDYVPKPPRLSELLGRIQKIVEDKRTGSGSLPTGLKQDDDRPFITVDPEMLRLLRRVDRLATGNSTVLLSGESGTGKELIARRLHALGPRRHHPFLPVSCALGPSELVESELFGHEPGSFTGAVRRRRGKFELARGGTLFLDEIGEAPEAFQVKLLRVLEERTFERLGGEETLTTDVRIIAATSRNLENEVRNGTFRPELFYRLNVFQLQLPPLSERERDIIPLAHYFLRLFADRQGSLAEGFTPQATEALLGYHWPGNVRELRNFMERVATFARGRQVGLPDFAEAGNSKCYDLSYHEAKERCLQDFQLRFVCMQLQRALGNVSEAARRCGLRRQVFQEMMRRVEVDPAQFRR